MLINLKIRIYFRHRALLILKEVYLFIVLLCFERKTFAYKQDTRQLNKNIPLVPLTSPPCTIDIELSEWKALLPLFN
jgi:hypothetical protein